MHARQEDVACASDSSQAPTTPSSSSFFSSSSSSSSQDDVHDRTSLVPSQFRDRFRLEDSLADWKGSDSYPEAGLEDSFVDWNQLDAYPEDGLGNRKALEACPEQLLAGHPTALDNLSACPDHPRALATLSVCPEEFPADPSPLDACPEELPAGHPNPLETFDACPEDMLTNWQALKQLGLQQERRALIHLAACLYDEDRPQYYRLKAEFERIVQQRISLDLYSDRGAMLAAVSVCGSLLSKCSDALQNDAQVALAALREDSTTIRHVGERLWENQGFTLQALHLNGAALEYASPALQADKTVVLAAVQKTGFALKHASEELQDDREVVVAAIERNAQALQYAGEALRADEEIAVQTLLRQQHEIRNSSMLRFADKGLKRSKDIVLLAVRTATTAAGAKDAYLQADPRIWVDFSWSEMKRIANSRLACRGEPAPILTVSLTEVFGGGGWRGDDADSRAAMRGSQEDEEEDELAYRTFLCEARLMSGATFSFYVQQTVETEVEADIGGPGCCCCCCCCCSCSSCSSCSRCSCRSRSAATLEKEEKGEEDEEEQYGNDEEEEEDQEEEEVVSRSDWTFGELADLLYEHLTCYVEGDWPDRIALVIETEDGESEVVSPWHCDVSLLDFLSSA